MSSTQLLAPEAITLRIATMRGTRALLDAELAALYEVETKCFNEAVRRNLTKFPTYPASAHRCLLRRTRGVLRLFRPV